MEVQDLRIGNYLKIDGILVRVRSVYSFTNGSFKNNEGTVEAYRYDSIFEPKKISAGINRFEPIPLTEEWLVKFGFVKDKKHDNCCDLKLENDFYLQGVGYGKSNIKYEVILTDSSDNELTLVKHVHQLQNLYFALTNQELTIKK
jgi:hypothetical protein